MIIVILTQIEEATAGSRFNLFWREHLAGDRKAISLFSDSGLMKVISLGGWMKLRSRKWTADIVSKMR